MGESVSKLTIDAGVQGGAAAASELQKIATSIDATGAAAQAAAVHAEQLAKSQGVLGRELAFAAESAKAAADAIEQSDTAETLKRQAEAAELARPAIEALAEAQQRLAQLQAEQAKGPAGRSVGEMLAFNDAIAKQEGLIRTLGGEQQQFNTKTQDLVGILNRINPRLGEMALGLIRLARVSGDVAASEINLKDVLGSVTDAVKQNVEAIALIGAGGAAIAAINGIFSAMAEGKRITDEVTASIREQAKALNELEKRGQDQASTIEKIAAKRKEGGLTAESSAAALQQAQRIKSKSGDLGEDFINTAVGNFTGTGASDEEIQRAAFALEQDRITIDPKASKERRLERLRRDLRKNETRRAVDIALATEQTQAGEVAGGAKAIKELKSGDGSTFHTEEFTRQLPGPLGKLPESQIAKVAEIAKKLPDIEGKGANFEDRLSISFLSSEQEASQLRGAGRSTEAHDLLIAQRRLADEGVKDATPELIREAQSLRRILERIEKNTGEPTIINNGGARGSKKNVIQDARP